MDRITGVLQAVGQISGRLSAPGGMAGNITLPERIIPPMFPGAYEYTPTQEPQVIEIGGMMAGQNITIDAIPNNYGRITWNGSVITVS